jgi:hypothetical protein
MYNYICVCLLYYISNKTSWMNAMRKKMWKSAGQLLRPVLQEYWQTFDPTSYSLTSGRTAPQWQLPIQHFPFTQIFVRMIHRLFYLEASVIQIQSLPVRYVFVYSYCSQDIKNIYSSVSEVPMKISAYHFGHVSLDREPLSTINSPNTPSPSHTVSSSEDVANNILVIWKLNWLYSIHRENEHSGLNNRQDTWYLFIVYIILTRIHSVVLITVG